MTTPSPTPGPFPPSFPPPEPSNVGDWLWSVVANIWSFVTDQAGPLSALAAILTAVIAIVALTATARDSRERSRPVVMAMFRLAEHSDTSFDFVVRNYGPSAARDVEVKFDPPLDDEARKQSTTQALAERFDARIPLLPPEAEVSNVYWSGKNDGSNKLVNKLRTPAKVTVTITYKGTRLRRYTEVVPLDADWMGLATHSVSSTSTPGRMKQIAESLKNIADETKSSRFLLRDIAEGVNPDQEVSPREAPGELASPEAGSTDGAVPEGATPTESR